MGDLDDEQGSDDLDGWLMDGTKEGEGSDAFPKIDVEGRAQISEGECALVCQDVAPPAEGVTKPIALDNVVVWTPSYRAVCATSIVEPSTSAAYCTSFSRGTDLLNYLIILYLSAY